MTCASWPDCQLPCPTSSTGSVILLLLWRGEPAAAAKAVAGAGWMCCCTCHGCMYGGRPDRACDEGSGGCPTAGG
jgi:hypothetical protein